MNTQLAAIKEQLQNIKAPVIQYLNDKASQNDIESFWRDFYPDIPIPQDFIDIYSWHNGTAVRTDIPAFNFYLFPGFYLNSLAEVRRIYAHKIYDFEKKKMFPLFSSGMGEHLVIDIASYLTDSEGTLVMEVQSWDPLVKTFETKYDSLNNLLDTIIECYKKGAYFVIDGELDSDTDKKWEISKEMNPKSAYWKQ
jgi:hypothetical protein